MPTTTRLTGKEPETRRDFIWGADTSAIEIITIGEFNTETKTINTATNITIQRLLHARTKYVPKPWRFLLGKLEEKEIPEEFWSKLVSLEHNCDFNDIKQKDLLISKMIISITNKKNYRKN